MEEYINMCSQFGAQANMTNEQMKELCTKVFPRLKDGKNLNKKDTFCILFLLLVICFFFKFGVINIWFCVTYYDF